MKRLALLPLVAALALTACAAGGAPTAARQAPAGLSARRAEADLARYYAPAAGKTGAALLRALHGVVAEHKDLGYSGARNVMFGTVDDPKGDNTVTCVYTGRAKTGVNDSNSSRGMNTEHTWPQSLGAEGVAKSDLHHLFPTETEANSKRSSFPFGMVTRTTWEDSGSKLGVDAAGNTVFEPRDAHKGNLARALLYFYTVYGVDTRGGGPFSVRNFMLEEETLKRWHVQDPVDATEQERNDRVFAAQGNRNPYVDHPEYVSAVGVFHPH